MEKRYSRVHLLLLLVVGTCPLAAQGFLEKVTDLLEFDVGQPRPQDTAHFVPKVVVAPLAYYEPNTNLGLGVGAKLLFKPGKSDAVTRTSNLPIAVSYTLNSQFFFSSGYTVFFGGEDYLLKGNLNYRDFPLGYYGIGNLTRDDERIDIQYQQFLFEPLLLRNLGHEIFVGGGFRYNTFYNTQLDEEVGELPKGFDLQDSLGSTSTGLEFAFTLDSRNNVLNARTGTLLEFTQGFYGEYLGGTHTFQLSKVDFRRYHSLGANTFAWSLYGRYAWSDTPMQELSTLGGAELLRGYREGRFRDRLALFGQAEYRYQAFERIGFVGFGGVDQVAGDWNKVRLGDMRYSVGAGARFLIIPSENLNLRIDYAFGFGPSKDSNFYVGIAEAF